MSKNTELAVFQKTIAIDGVKFNRTGLEFARVDQDTLLRVGAFLQAVDACSSWWWGDFLAAYCGYELKEEEKENGHAFDELTKCDKEKQYASKYALICDRDATTLWHWRSVANFFNSFRRRQELSHTHHVEAQNGSDGDEAIADNWLDLAEKHKWSVSQLRAAIRKSKRLEGAEDEPMPQMLLPMELVAAGRWANMAAKRVDSMDINEVAAIYAEMKPILAYASLLAQRLIKGSGGKESITAPKEQR